MQDYEKLMQGTKQMLDESSKETKPYLHEVLGKGFIVLPGVFSPKYFEDTEFFSEQVPKFKNGNWFLEVGCGTGIVSCFAAQVYSVVYAVDINPEAIRNTNINTLLHHIPNVQFFRSDVYDSASKFDGYDQGGYFPGRRNLKFDTIFWNVPFGDHKCENPGMLEKAVWDPQYKNIRRFVQEAKDHLNSEGQLLIGYSSMLGNAALLHDIVNENNFEELEILAESPYVQEGDTGIPIQFQLLRTEPK